MGGGASDYGPGGSTVRLIVAEGIQEATIVEHSGTGWQIETRTHNKAESLKSK